MIRYAEGVYALAQAAASVRDRRRRPRIPCARVVKSLLLIFWARLGSLHALDEERPGGRWRRWLGGDIPSEDTLGDVAAGMELDDLRRALRRHYHLRRRKKTLRPFAGRWWALILDGHEGNASYLRQCPHCLRRTVHAKQGDRTQFHHRHVLALLRHRDGVLLLDVEPQLPGEDEMAPALRLLGRALREYPRAFNLVGGDALYLNPGFCRLALDHGKHFIAVLKNEHRDLLVDARSLFAEHPPVCHRTRTTDSQWWDIEGFTTWTQLGRPVRVVRSVETHTVRRQRTGKLQTHTSEWFWATSLPAHTAPTHLVVQVGHGRWAIENDGFNDLVRQWHADHVYKHALNAMMALWLLVCLAYNLFTVFLTRNLKPQVRRGRSRRFWVRRIVAEFVAGLPVQGRSP